MWKMILAGTSASAGYDGFLPTSNGANIRQIDVPMVQPAFGSATAARHPAWWRRGR